jgi:tetratricopeptide (TPR) repeat protein
MNRTHLNITYTVIICLGVIIHYQWGLLPSVTFVAIPTLFINLIYPGSQTSEFYCNRGSLWYYLHDYQGAIRDYNRAIQLSPNFAKAYYLRGRARAQLKDDLGAKAEFDEAIRLKPDFAEAYESRGNIWSKLGDEQAAITDYDQAIRLKPIVVEAYRGHDDLHGKIQDDPSAIVNPDQTNHQRESQYFFKTEKSSFYFLRGVLSYLYSDYQDAIVRFEKAIQENPKSINIISHYYYLIGISHLKLKDYPSAISIGDRLTDLAPDLILGYKIRGRAHAHLQNNEEALADCNEVIRLRRKHKVIYDYWLRGVIYFRLERYQEALDDFSKILARKPKLAEIYAHRGHTRAYLQDYDGAMADLNQSIRLKPSLAVAYGERGHVQTMLGADEAAISDLNQAITLDPELAAAYYYRGDVYAAQQNYPVARTNYEKAAELAQAQSHNELYEKATQKLDNLAS